MFRWCRSTTCLPREYLENTGLAPHRPLQWRRVHPIETTRQHNMKKLLLIALTASLAGFVAQAADEDKKPERPRPEGQRPDRAAQIKKYDKNNDGKLDDDERAAMRKDREAEMLKRFDKNNDGKLDDEERAAMRKGRQGGEGRPDAPKKDQPK
jgi:hypothetical protein